MKERTLIEVLKENKEFKKSINSKVKKPITISLLSNNIINQIQPVLENWAYSNDLAPIINFGEFDNIVQDSNIYSSSDVVIIFWELNNIVDGFQYSSTKLTANTVNTVATIIRKRTLKALRENIGAANVKADIRTKGKRKA